MGDMFDQLKSALVGSSSKRDLGPYSVADKGVVCAHCGHKEFALTKALLNTRLRTVLGVDADDPSAYVLVCGHCSCIVMFASEPQRD